MIIDVLLSDKVEIERNGQKQTLIITDEQKSKILGGEGKGFVTPRLIETTIDSIIPKSEADIAGLLNNDQIIAVNGSKFIYFDELSIILESKKSDSIQLTVLRNDKEVTINSKVDIDGKLGFYPTFKDKKSFITINKLTLLQAIPAAIEESYTQFVYNIKQFKLLLRPKTEAYKHVKSPIGITRQLPTEWDWEFVWSFTAMFSIGLAFMNLLPIPGLDGGHALFTIAEMITGKTLSIKNAERVQTFGMVILLSLMALTFGKDIYQLICDKFL
jgi:regulator of sigma E protease